jgi:hypothetical protein
MGRDLHLEHQVYHQNANDYRVSAGVMVSEANQAWLTPAKMLPD